MSEKWSHRYIREEDNGWLGGLPQGAHRGQRVEYIGYFAFVYGCDCGQSDFQDSMPAAEEEKTEM